MEKISRIKIDAPLHKVFLAAADLTRWPEFLPHYRHNRFLSQTPSGGVVKMSSIHAGLQMNWTSQFQIDPERHELRFTHLQSPLGVSRGMEVIWTFQETDDGGVEVIITHQLAVAWPFVGRFMANKIVGAALIQRLAEKTLAGLKRKVEAQQHAELAAAKVKKISLAKRRPAKEPPKNPRPQRQKPTAKSSTPPPKPKSRPKKK